MHCSTSGPLPPQPGPPAFFQPQLPQYLGATSAMYITSPTAHLGVCLYLYRFHADNQTTKCEPVGREWPEKCARCISKGYSCSPNTRKRKNRTLESLTAKPPPRLRETLDMSVSAQSIIFSNQWDTSANQSGASVEVDQSIPTTTPSNPWAKTGPITRDQLIIW